MRNASRNNGVRVGNGSVEGASKIRDLVGTIFNKHGQEINKIKMKEVSVIPENHVSSGIKFNMFSLTNRQKDGWVLHGNDKAIWLTKGKNKVVFDIVIHTHKGLVFAMYIKRHAEIGCVGVIENGKKMILQQDHDK